jgi:hypothetical protein
MADAAAGSNAFPGYVADVTASGVPLYVGETQCGAQTLRDEYVARLSGPCARVVSNDAGIDGLCNDTAVQEKETP